MQLIRSRKLMPADARPNVQTPHGITLSPNSAAQTSSTTQVIDGKQVASALRARIARRAAELASRHQLTPGLAVVLVGEDPARAR